MKANELIRAVDKAVARKWRGSNLSCLGSEKMLVEIANHMRDCVKCREEFDAMGYECKTLRRFELDQMSMLSRYLTWVCEEYES